MAYISWTFLKMGDRADRKTGLVFLLIALAPVILVSVLAFIIGLGAIVYGWPALLPMLVPFYLPFALRRETGTAIKSGHVLFDKDPLVVTSRPVVRNWVYAVYAVMPALSLILSGWHMTLDRGGNGSALAAFALIWIALYSTFLLLSLVLGKIGYLKIGRFFPAAAVNIVLVLCYSVWGL